MDWTMVIGIFHTIVLIYLVVDGMRLRWRIEKNTRELRYEIFESYALKERIMKIIKERNVLWHTTFSNHNPKSYDEAIRHILDYLDIKLVVTQSEEIVPRKE